MDEARQVLERLERIDRLRSGGGQRGAILAEVRALLEEGEAWLAAEPAGTASACEALEACRLRLLAGETGAAEAPPGRVSGPDDPLPHAA
jgi:hypothetical protein